VFGGAFPPDISYFTIGCVFVNVPFFRYNVDMKKFVARMYINAYKKRLYWIHYTMIAGALPLIIRVIVSLSMPGSNVPMVAIGEFVFWGIMFNSAAIYNISNVDNVPDVQVGFTTSAFARTVLLVAIYTLAFVPGISPTILWLIAAFLTLTSLVASYLTTDSSFLRNKQNIYDYANHVEGLPPTIRDKVRKVAERAIVDGKNMNIDEEIAECFRQ
jgi:hypothetical protein